MELCTSPLFTSFPCAHPKIIPFREETLDQKSLSKQYLSHVSLGLTEELLSMQIPQHGLSACVVTGSILLWSVKLKVYQ